MSDDNATIDQVDAEEVGVDDSDNGKVEKHIKSRSTWLRLLFICVYGLLLGLVGMVGTAVVAFGFLWLLFTGEVNPELQRLGQSIARYIYEITRYMTLNSDTRPFPFGSSWPAGEAEG